MTLRKIRVMNEKVEAIIFLLCIHKSANMSLQPQDVELSVVDSINLGVIDSSHYSHDATFEKGALIEARTDDNNWERSTVTHVEGNNLQLLVHSSGQVINRPKNDVRPLTLPQIPKCLRLHHFVFFGKEERTYSKDDSWYSINSLKKWFMPVLWALMATAALIFYFTAVYNKSKVGMYYAFIVVGLYVEMIANYYFALSWLQIDRIRRLVAELLPNKARQNDYIRYLTYIWFVSGLFGAAYTFLDDELYYRRFEAHRLVRDILIAMVGYWNTFYLCGIWNWEVCMFYESYMETVYTHLGTNEVGRHSLYRQKGITGDLSRFKDEFLCFSLHVCNETKRWAVNHCIRMASGLLIAFGYTELIYHYREPLSVALPLFFMIAYYLSLWGTTYCAAYVTEMITSQTIDRLTYIIWQSDDQEKERPDIFYLINTIPKVFRLNVGGFPMSTGVAITIGSSLLYAIFAFTKLHTLKSEVSYE